MGYKQKDADFDAVQWTGSNQAAFTAFVSANRGGEWTWTVRADSTLYGTFSMDYLLIPLNSWFVVGPRWGGELPSDVPYTIVSAGQFDRKFQQKP
jgi:hypothetical protein